MNAKSLSITKSSAPVKARTTKFLRRLNQLVQAQQKIISQLRDSIKNNSALDMKLVHTLEMIGSQYSMSKTVGSVALGQILSLYKESWDSLPDSFTQKYNDYYDYVRDRYDLGSQMADMYVEVWEAIYSGKYLKPKDIPSFVDLSRISIPKQAVAAQYIVKRTMTPVRWKILADTDSDRSELRRNMKFAGRSKKMSVSRSSNGVSGTQLVQETGDLRIFINGQHEQVGFLNINSSNPVVIQEIRRITKVAGIRKVK